ncbi:MAG TPA: SprT-like domain-containing protein [Candidatus Entotheonella sp.]|jgi:hypothetical protein
MPTRTEQVYSEMQLAYDVFNRDLFGGQLPPCLISMQPKARTYGYVPRPRWNGPHDEMAAEIIINPAHCAERSAQEVLSALAHEMTHLWQHHFGKPSRMGYHNREWADKMTEIGLCPSDTGEVGGKQTGQRMSHYVIAGGAFARASADLLAQGVAASWQDWAMASRRNGPEPKKPASRCKYTCILCGLNVWAKPNISLYCGECELELLASG